MDPRNSGNLHGPALWIGVGILIIFFGLIGLESFDRFTNSKKNAKAIANRDKAALRLNEISNIVYSHPEFSNVIFKLITREDGGLEFRGFVSSQADERKLMEVANNNFKDLIGYWRVIVQTNTSTLGPLK